MEKPMQQSHLAHVLFELTLLDHRDDIDEKTQKHYLNLKQMVAGKSAKECHEIYLKYISTNPQHLEELTLGLLVAILVEPDGQQSKYYRDVVTISKDSLGLFSNYLNTIIIERLSKLRDHSVQQIFWITRQLMKAAVVQAENVCSNLIRQTAGGDLSARNLRLVENLLDTLIENRSWLINSTNFMVPTIVYTFMRLISDHLGPSQNNLRQREVEFVIGLIREKFLDCMQIGRDFMRLLHIIVKIPEFEKLWHDIYNNPKSLHPSFQNPLQLLSNRTPRRLFQSRLTFEMERKIAFLATQVKFGSQKRFQDWFHKQYLATPESLSLRCDLIRYICTIIHPSNEVLCSDIIPRWAIIGWLLTTCTTSASATNGRLALFFDWLLYDAKMDNIMNIEPAILVMYHSIRSHPNVTVSLLDFLCRIPALFSPKLSEHIRAGIKKSLQQILEKRVVQSLAPLFDNPKHDPALRSMIRENFPEFCAPHVDNGTPHLVQPVVANQPNAASLTSANHVSPAVLKQTKQEPDVIVIDPEKTCSVTDPASIISEAIAGAKTHVNHDSINHIGRPGYSDQTTQLSDDKSEQTAHQLAAKEEGRAFSWNGTDNVNASYSHKQNHEIKARKSSVSVSSEITKKIKGSLASSPSPATPDTSTNEGANNISMLLNLSNSSTTSPVPVTTPILPAGEPNADLARDDPSRLPIKVIYQFLVVPDLDLKESLNSFDKPIKTILEDLSVETSQEARCSLMDKLISTVFDNSDQQSSNTNFIKDLGHCLAHLLTNDFSSRIFPSSSQDNESLEESIATPFFSLCRSAFSSNRSNLTLKPMSLLVAISKYFEATGFLSLYFLRVSSIVNGTNIANGYSEFCSAAKRKVSKCLLDDLTSCLTYDSEMFCFLLPSVFGEIASSGSFAVTGNIELIHMVVSAIDPVNLQELICLCLTGTTKIINRDNVLPLIETSLDWESWEQYCVWRLVNAQNTPIDNYIQVLPKLNPKANAEAMSSILLNLQKVSEPTADMLESIFNCECKPNEPFTSSIIRYWSMKTDVKDLAHMIVQLCDSHPSSPPAKRKGQAKSSAKNSTTLSSRSEKVLYHLDLVRQRAPKNKLLAQPEILEMLSQLESTCNESQKRKYSDLFSNRPKPTKKQKKTEKETNS